MSFADAVTVGGTTCPACERREGRVFYRVEAIPTSMTKLSRTRNDAIPAFSRAGQIQLAFCDRALGDLADDGE